jgi:predicted transcriptional regulator
MTLSPTLWRTCRVLSGSTRLALFRRISKNPGLSVGALARAERISLGRTSQELRRLQSRGIVSVKRTGRFVRYYPEPDPSVPSAPLVLRALQETCARFRASADDRTARLAAGVSHEKRLAMVRALQVGPLAVHEMQAVLKIPAQTLWHHLRFLETGGWVERERGRWKLAPNDHPLAKCLLKLA